jgi:hypothetical protein
MWDKERCKLGAIPRQARLDSPGASHHVMGRGSEGIYIFRSDEDREDFPRCLEARREGEILIVHAWGYSTTLFIFSFVR